MRTKPPQKQSDPLFSWAEGSGVATRFIEELSLTLDLDKTIRKLNMSRQEASAILKGLVPYAASIVAPKSTEASKEAAPALGAGTYLLYVDGASRGNPGKAGAGALISAPDGTPVKRLKSYLGVATNNVAEYRALIIALQAAHSLKIKRVAVHADSELVVKQIKGVYKVKHPALAPLYAEAMGLLKGFAGFKITHVPREKNKEADRLANEAIDHGQK